jgi:DNA-binding CsgD family transcriptional regulator
VDILIIGMILLNALLFTGLGTTVMRQALREPSPRTRDLALAFTAVCGAFVLGAVQRLALQAHRLGLLPDQTAERLLFEYQLLKSISALGLAVCATILAVRALRSVRESERLVRVLTDGVPTLPVVSEIGLTNRELEILEVMRTGIVTDRELAVALGISPHTAHTHVRNIMGKAEVRSRRGLILLPLRRTEARRRTRSTAG